MTALTIGLVFCNHTDYSGDEAPQRCKERVRAGRRASEAREAARQLGWDVGSGRGGADYCPAHKRPVRRAMSQKETADA